MAIKILLNGANGKMGRMLINCSRNFSEIEKIFEVDLPNKNKAKEFIEKADVAIDFSSPEGTMEIAQIAFSYLKPLVVGTTGLTQEQLNELKSKSKKIPLFVSPNMSYAVNLTFIIAKILAEKLDFDIHIHETHHSAKRDIPSGTALRYVDFISSTGKKTTISSARLGNIVGEHILTFAGENEKVVLSHIAYSREIFARGALNVAFWLVRQSPGFYTFQDIFGL